MKESRKAPRNGIQKKYFRLIVVMIVMIMAVFVFTKILQSIQVSTIVESTSEKQKEVITSFSENVMETMIARRLSNTVEMEAQSVTRQFDEFASAVRSLGKYTETLFRTPQNFVKRSVPLPDASKDGQGTMQLLSEEGVDISSPEIREKIEQLGALTDFMLSVYDYSVLDSLYVAIPEGVMILIDDHPSSKYTEDGKEISVPIHECEWYTGAVESKDLYFTGLIRDVFTDSPMVTCSLPVYQNGELVAVVGADLFADGVEETIQESHEMGDTILILDANGKLIFSPLNGEELGLEKEEEEMDLREYKDPEVASFVKGAYEGAEDVVMVEFGGEKYYMVGKPVGLVGWAVIHAVKKELLNEPTVMTKDQIDELMSQAVFSVNKQIVRDVILIVGVLVLLLFVALMYAKKISALIVNPLETMTKRLSSIRGEDLLFEMEDTYRTGDEIEVLAESFADMSGRTVQYVEQVKTVTAEKERIGAELSLAASIQASQLPSRFPAFPDRKEFYLYASMEPAKEVGGDFYDFYLVDDDHLALIIADVSGKGVPAALFMMVSRGLIKSSLKNGNSPGEALKIANDQLNESNEASLFVTVWAAVIEISTGKGIAVNAGHEHPALRKGNGGFQLVEYDHDPAVAILEGMTFEEHAFTIEPGDCLFVYTDGVAEAQNRERELFGTDRMLEALNKDPGAEPEELIGNVAKGIESFVKDAEQFDDITMLCFRYDGGLG